MQSEKILERIANSGNKLYLEFGGKLFDDHHARRVLPGFKYDAKIQLLQTLKDQSEIILCISTKDIEKNKIRADHGITYSKDILRLIDEFRDLKLNINSVVITQYNKEPESEVFKKVLENAGIDVYLHSYIEGYGTDVDLLISDSGYGMNEYVKTTKPLVVVTAPGPGSGKLATCLSQLYHDYKEGVVSGYAKFETFPVWDLPLKHPLNIAYEAATADLADIIMIDPFHMEAYNTPAVNYNRDIEAFPILRDILKKITGKDIYKSPTDMGVNTIGACIEDDNVIREASKQEVIRRYYKAVCDNKKGLVSEQIVERLKLLMSNLQITPLDRDVVTPALEKSNQSGKPSVSIKLHSGEIVTGRDTDIITAGASGVLNSIKHIANLDDSILLIAENILKPIQNLKKMLFNDEKVLLDTNDVLLALSVCAATDEVAELALSKLKDLQNVQAHSTYMFTNGEEGMYRYLKICITSEPNLKTNRLYQ
ncbi:MAG: DUF1846 domain-containing protein [Oscillospiraceae bacterium]|nr:DUF1846 domain-containing protein [Oscillospiraceae bacterium]